MKWTSVMIKVHVIKVNIKKILVGKRRGPFVGLFQWHYNLKDTLSSNTSMEITYLTCSPKADPDVKLVFHKQIVRA